MSWAVISSAAADAAPPAAQPEHLRYTTWGLHREIYEPRSKERKEKETRAKNAKSKRRVYKGYWCRRLTAVAAASAWRPTSARRRRRRRSEKLRRRRRRGKARAERKPDLWSSTKSRYLWLHIDRKCKQLFSMVEIAYNWAEEDYCCSVAVASLKM